MKAYKGFDKNMRCRGFQYEEGKEYTTGKAELCNSGFHACENPLDCFGYYKPAESVFHEVELDATDEKTNDDSKRVGKRIKIGARLDVAGICKAHFEYVKEHTTCEEQGKDNANLSARDWSSLSAQDESSLSAGKDSILAAFNSKAKAGMGSLIALATRKWIDGEYKITGCKAAVVDGVMLKPDTWYKLVNGELVEVDDEEEE